MWTSIYFSCILRHTTWWFWLPNHLPHSFSHMSMFANNALLGGGVRVRVWIREQRKIKRRSKALLSLWWQTWTSLLLLDAKLIVRLKNKTMLEVSTCGMSPPTCALCACELFMRVRWVMVLVGDAKQADKKWNWTNWTGGNGLVMLLWPLVDVEIYLMYFCSWQLLTVAIWLIQPMARLITLLEHYWDRMPPTVVTQATTW